jgi:hypothetical protein
MGLQACLILDKFGGKLLLAIAHVELADSTGLTRRLTPFFPQSGIGVFFNKKPKLADENFEQQAIIFLPRRCQTISSPLRKCVMMLKCC